MAMQELNPAARRLDVFVGSGPCQKILPSWVRHLPLTAAGPLSGSVWCHRVLVSLGRCNETAATGPPSGRKRTAEKRWELFFSDPSQWWDHRLGKLNARYPDFKHRRTQQGLWLDSELTPPWVRAELAAMAPGTVQLSSFSWNARLQKSIRKGQYMKTIEIFKQMQQEGAPPDTFTLTSVLNACGSLQALAEGRHIHEQIIQIGLESDVYVANSLIDMYCKCGSMENASLLFEKMLTPNVISWNSLLLGYARCGQGKKALEISQLMKQKKVAPDKVTFLGLLKACASEAALEEGRVVHRQIIDSGYECDVFVGSSLVDMYAKCGSIEDAWSVFSKIPTRDVVCWNAMILGHVKCGKARKALELYRQLQLIGMEPDPLTFVGALNACSSLMALEEGRSVHMEVMKWGYESSIFVGNSLIDMYAKCESLEDAWIVFNTMPRHDVVSWNIMILGHVKGGLGQTALELSRRMELEKVEPDRVTFLALLSACASIGALEEGSCIHRKIIEMGYESDIFVGSSLIHMYSKCESIEAAERVFNKMPERNVVSWNAMIMGYVKCRQGQKALELSRQMQWAGVEPDSVTLYGVLNACTSAVVHKSRAIEEAWRVFNKIPTRNVDSWNAMILGHLKCGQGQEALELSRKMRREGVEPDRVTFVGVLNACGSIEALEEGRGVHTQIIEHGCESDVVVGSSLVEMYAKCGSIEDAWRVFKKMPIHNMVSWNAMIELHEKCGQGQKALELCHQMERERMQPNLVPLCKSTHYIC